MGAVVLRLTRDGVVILAGPSVLNDPSALIVVGEVVVMLVPSLNSIVPGSCVLASTLIVPSALIVVREVVVKLPVSVVIVVG